MSLINDALRRARQAQHENTPVAKEAGPSFRAPVTPRQPQRTSWLPGAALAAVGLTSLFLAWNYGGRSSGETLEAKARHAAPAEPAATETPVPAVSPQPVAQTPHPVQEPTPIRPDVSVIPPPVSNVAMAVQTQVPAPPPPKLQAIIYNPRRPSAIIDGKTLFVGDRVRGMALISVSPTGATLAGGGQTNRLVLDP